MNIQIFAALNGLKVVKDQCDEEIILGRIGHIFDHGSGMYGIVLEDTPFGPSRARLLLSQRKAALQGGFKMIQEGACESTLLFNPTDPNQAKLAIRLVKAARKRSVRPSPASLRNLVKTSTQMPLQPVETTQSQRMALLT